MTGWLSLWDQPEQPPAGGHMVWMNDAEGHGHDQNDGTGTGDTAMPGMATSEELARLRALSGEELDVYFLQLMLRHHQGGLPMAEYAVEPATVPVVATLAQTMVDGQEYEIGLMESMLAERGAEPLPPPF
jgi:uncharacterized protein (DUF305 family)